MKTVLRTVIGNLMIASGLGIYAWLWSAATTTGRGLQLKVTVLDAYIPAMIPIWTGLGLIVLGLAIAYGRRETKALATNT